MTDKTIQFSIKEERDEEMRQVLRTVYDALARRGITPSARLLAIFFQKIQPISPRTTMREALFASWIGTNCYRLWCAVIWMRNSPLCIIRLRGGLPVGGPPFCEPSAVAFLTRGGKYAMINRF